MKSSVPVFFRDWHVIMPVFNESDHLDDVLSTLVTTGYLSRITFVNDASTDNSGEILEKWRSKYGFKVIHLSENRKKEGAIREVLERMVSRGQLPDFTILLDADSYMVREEDHSFETRIEKAMSHMEALSISGMAFRITAIVPERFSPFQYCISADYTGSQIDNWLTSKTGHLWVINGPGGIFSSHLLLDTLREIVPDFETGDLLITVGLMKRKCRVEFWPDITVKTWVPSSFGEYFAQRRRWERGTLKVLWTERVFYTSLIRRSPILFLLTLIYLIFPVGLMTTPAALLITSNKIELIVSTIVWSYLLWCLVTAVKCIANPWSSRHGRFCSASIGWPFLNGFLFLIATGPARFVGLIDTLRAVHRREMPSRSKTL